MTQSVKTTVANLFNDPKSFSSGTVKSKSSGNDFSSIMDSNLKAKSTAKNQDIPVKEKLTDSAKEEIKSNKRLDVSTEDKKADMNVSVEKSDKVDSTTDVVSTADEQKEDKIGKEDNSFDNYIQNLLALLQDAVRNNLELTEEELEKAMESLGLTAADLLNPDNLKALALKINGKADITEVLTDENLANTLKQLLQAVDDLKAEQNVTFSSEELKEMLSNSLSATESQTEIQSTANPAPVVPENNVQDASGDDKANISKDGISIEVIKTQDDSVTSDDLKSDVSDSKDNDQADIQMSSPLDMLIQDLAIKGNENTLNFNEQIASVREMQDITNQIVEQIKITIKPDQTSMELQLNPESLGKINLSVVSKDGIMTAKFTTENEIVKEIIENQLQILKDNLNNQGLKVEAIEVTVSEFSFSQSNQTSAGNDKGNQNSSRNRNLVQGETEIYTNSVEEEQTYSNLYQSESSVDYTA